MSPETVPVPPLLSVSVKLPQHVVYRSFPAETVVLNLQTGRYHGLNPTGGRMLEALEHAGSVRAAAVGLAESYDQPQTTIERDLCELCDALLERGLIEIDGGPAL
jgi:hypothetical protein